MSIFDDILESEEESQNKKKVEKKETPNSSKEEPKSTKEENRNEEGSDLYSVVSQKPVESSESILQSISSEEEQSTSEENKSKQANTTSTQLQVTNVQQASITDIIEEEPPVGKEVYVIYGDKGEGKTTLALSFPGEILALSFDRKTSPIRWNIYGNRKDIHVYDPVKFWKQTDDKTIVTTSKDVYNVIEKIFDKYQANKVDWVIFDGAEIMEQICEYVMRANHGLTAYEGIRNLNLWKERRSLLRHLHNRALEVARKGVIYILWTELEQIIVDSEVIQQKKVPKWIDIIMFEADYVIYVYRDPKDGRYKARVDSTKNPKKIPPGEYDVTDVGIKSIAGDKL